MTVDGGPGLECCLVSVELISVIVPVLRDSVELEGLLGVMPSDPGIELVVVNGGASDGVMERTRAARADVRWLDARAGRGPQLNAGAKSAAGSWLVFVHVDARLPSGWRQEIERAELSGAVGGAFALRLRSPAPQARRIERFVAWRVRRFGLPYGDQALFVRRDVFDAVEGYPDWPLFEDVEFVTRMRRAGRVWHSSLAVEVSARRWEREGWLWRSSQNVMLLALYFAGVSPTRLARWYYRRTECPTSNPEP